MKSGALTARPRGIRVAEWLALPRSRKLLRKMWQEVSDYKSSQTHSAVHVTSSSDLLDSNQQKVYNLMRRPRTSSIINTFSEKLSANWVKISWQFLVRLRHVARLKHVNRKLIYVCILFLWLFKALQDCLTHLEQSNGWESQKQKTNHLVVHSFVMASSDTGFLMSLVTRKPVFGVCDQLRLKQVCSATETR